MTTKIYDRFVTQGDAFDIGACDEGVVDFSGGKKRLRWKTVLCKAALLEDDMWDEAIFRTLIAKYGLAEIINSIEGSTYQTEYKDMGYAIDNYYPALYHLIEMDRLDAIRLLQKLIGNIFDAQKKREKAKDVDVSITVAEAVMYGACMSGVSEFVTDGKNVRMIDSGRSMTIRQIMSRLNRDTNFSAICRTVARKLCLTDENLHEAFGKIAGLAPVDACHLSNCYGCALNDIMRCQEKIDAVKDYFMEKQHEYVIANNIKAQQIKSKKPKEKPTNETDTSSV